MVWILINCINNNLMKKNIKIKFPLVNLLILIIMLAYLYVCIFH